MMGATLVTSATDESDHHNFERWSQYWRSGDAAKTQHAVNELLLRLERVRFEPVPACAGSDSEARTSPARSISNRRAMSGGSAISSPRTSCDDIDCVDIAAAVGIHPEIRHERVQEDRPA